MSMWQAIGRSAVLLMALAAPAHGPADAQTAPPDGSSPGRGGTPEDQTKAAVSTLTHPDNGGIAGTGLGKMPSDDKTGTGMSVKGPAGQGIDPGLAGATKP